MFKVPCLDACRPRSTASRQPWCSGVNLDGATLHLVPRAASPTQRYHTDPHVSHVPPIRMPTSAWPPPACRELDRAHRRGRRRRVFVDTASGHADRPAAAYESRWCRDREWRPYSLEYRPPLRIRDGITRPTCAERQVGRSAFHPEA